jgi:hypothetical protein
VLVWGQVILVVKSAALPWPVRVSTRFCTIRRFNTVSVTIVLLWLLSPLGGQLASRVLTFTTVGIDWQTNITYFNPFPHDGQDLSGSFVSLFRRGSLSGRSIMTILVGASLLSPESVQKSPVDQWNNLKIPRLDESKGQTDGAGDIWMPVNSATNNIWTSLSGLMIQGIHEDANSTFSIETSYIDVACLDGSAFATDQNMSQFLHDYGLAGETTDLADPFSWDAYAVSSFVDSRTTAAEFYKNSSIESVYGLNMGDRKPGAVRHAVYLYNCTLTTPRVEGHVVCNGTTCAMAEIRRSQRDLTSPKTPPFTFEEYINLLAFLPRSLGCYQSATPVDFYLLQPDGAINADASVLNWSKRPGNEFGKRLTTLVNTVWQASMAPFGIQEGASANSTYSSSNEVENIPSAMTTAVVSRNAQQYTANRMYIGLLMAITLTLLAYAIASSFLSLMTRAPDVLGYVSTMTRDNPFIQVPAGGSTLDGAQRARFLADIQVRLGDVLPMENVGHVAFQRVGNSDDGRAGRLERSGRLYL